MIIPEKEYAEFKAICAKQGISYKSEAEYREAANNLISLVKIIYDSANEHSRWNQRLKQEPKGFAIESNGRSCCLCHQSVMGQVWFDKWGLKCLTCQEALNKKIVPGYIFKDSVNKRHVTASQLNWKYGILHQAIHKLIKQGKLKPRIIPNGITLFLRSENPDLPNILKEIITNT